MRPLTAARKCAVIVSASISVFVSGCGQRSAAPSVPAQASIDNRPLLPDDLDVVLWLNLVRLRNLWTRDPERQVLSVMQEYGFVAAPDGSTDRELWQRVLKASSQIWIACRPAISGCRDAVLFARGSFDDALPEGAVTGFSRPMLTTNGWSRYERLGNAAREEVARIYGAFPDRLVTATPAELDSTERSIELNQGTSTIPVERRGILSLSMRASSLARVLSRRSPAAAQLLRQSTLVKLWLDVETEQASLTVVVGFDDARIAERTREAWLLVARSMSNLEHQGIEAITTEIVGAELVLRIPVRSQSSSSGALRAEPQAPAPVKLPDSAAQ